MKARWTVTVVLLLFNAGLFAQSQPEPPTSVPIRLHPRNPHYFLFRGKAIALITSGEHYGSVINSDFDYHEYLMTLRDDGLNYTRIFPGSYVEVPGKSFGILRNTLAPDPENLIAPWARSTVPGYAGGGNKFDLATWNPEYFDRLHGFLTQASRLGIVVEITLFSSQYGEMQWKMSPFHPENNVNNISISDYKKVNTLENGGLLGFQEQYTRKLVREANGFDNVIFEIQNEPFSDHPALQGVVNPYLLPPARDNFPNTIETADQASLDWQARVAQWIESEESQLPKKHLIAQNCCDFGLPAQGVIPGVGVLNFHYAYPATVSANYGLGIALAYDETGFLGTSDASYLREAWNFMLSGGSAFDGLDYSFTVGHEDGSERELNGPGGGSAKLRAELGILRRYLDKFNLVALSPDSYTVRRATGVYARVLSNPGREYAIYLDGQDPADLTLELPPGQYTGEWTNPVTGEIQPLPSFYSSGVKILRAPEFKQGMALRLKRVERHLTDYSAQKMPQ